MLGMEFTRRVTEFKHGRIFSVSKNRFCASRGANELISRIADVFLMQETPGSCLVGLVEARRLFRFRELAGWGGSSSEPRHGGQPPWQEFNYYYFEYFELEN